MTVRADEIALSELRLEQPGAAAPRKRREIPDLGGPWAVIKRHRDRVKASPAVNARVSLQLAHSRDKLILPFAPLDLAELSCPRVVLGIPFPATRLAPELVTTAASMEIAYRLLDSAQRASAQIELGM